MLTESTGGVEPCVCVCVEGLRGSVGVGVQDGATLSSLALKSQQISHNATGGEATLMRGQ